ncbi:phosphoenolpyruvate carboxylase [Muriicola marianensis]|uniref:Phosphoenolpyruvate carboxylase n=1 Tax=Muriicola marianensis TaxID=1324801 RepID=A0ABQ1QSP6_9FLAO|nr:phosphoenolpyruvate carboxylase [Muriicola marianensis]GGD44228.1 phosphoenolpyruvate carboxylase [Muriicola marianensis]
MPNTKRLEEFKKLVTNKFYVYNSLFLNLPYQNMENIGVMIPLLFQQCQQGLSSGRNPREIMDHFFEYYAQLPTEQERIDFMFKIIQYVERQVVLYDSVEDAAFPRLQEFSTSRTIRDYFQMVDTSRNWKTISRQLENFSARIVLTAHPTQFYTPAVLDIIDELRRLILDDKINDIDLVLQQLGLTSLINAKKPTPLEEARNIIYILRHIYYDAVGDLYSHIKRHVRQEKFENYNILKLGFWPGGDRDGNPYVTAEITRSVADELRVTLMKCYYNELKALRKKLTFKGVNEPLNALLDKLYVAMFDLEKALSFEEIITPLEEIQETIRTQYKNLYGNDLEKLIDKVKIFRTHFAILDIRQDHSKHYQLVEKALFKAGKISSSLSELTEKELTRILLKEQIALNEADFEDEIHRDTIKNIKQLSAIKEKNGDEGCNRYIISNSEDIFSVLFVYALFRWCGYKPEDISFDIVPLFETMKGMDRSEKIMTTLFSLPEYKAHLKRRDLKQTMMLGFSDGTKDGGYLRANWSIFKTKETLSKVCSKHGYKAIFFDGRGGPPARGGGKTHRFYAAQTREIANNEIQLTIQGQTITSTYGTKEQFIHNSEQLLTAGLSNNLFGKENVITASSRKLMEELSRLSFEKYDALKQHPKFIPYLEHKSTLKYYTRANIGSRPGKRGQKAKLELTDLRAISFVGSWSQLKQNVPGYYGIGTALNTLVEKGKLKDLKKLYREVPFFEALMLNSMMALSKCYFELTAYMKDDPEFGEFWELLHEEFELSKRMLLKISGFKILMENESISRESVKIRENIVLPLLVIQQYALARIGEGEDAYKEVYEKIVTRSLYGNINASRNSA